MKVIIKKSVKLREEILVAAYSYHGVLNDQYFPPIMSNNWTTAIGHKAVLAHHLNGQKLGILPLGKRILVTDNSKMENSITKSENRISNLQNKVNEIRYQADAVSFGKFSESYLNDNEN